MFFYLPDLSWLSIRPWMTYHGRLNRKEFWSFYAFTILVTFFAVLVLSTLAGKFPTILIPFFPYIFFALTLFVMILLCFAMIRRLRDSAFHWVLVPLSILSLFIAILSFQTEAKLYQINQTYGLQDLWLDQRWHITEISGLVALFFNLVLIFGLTRKTRYPK